MPHYARCRCGREDRSPEGISKICPTPIPHPEYEPIAASLAPRTSPACDQRSRRTGSVYPGGACVHPLAMKLPVNLASAPWTMAQTKIGGSLECSSPTFHQTMEVGDRGCHTMALSQKRVRVVAAVENRRRHQQGRCPVPLHRRARDGARETGYNPLVMSNGDSIFMHYAGFVKSNRRKPASGVGTFALSGGTGKFLGIYGNGTSVSHSAADGEMTVRVESEADLERDWHSRKRRNRRGRQTGSRVSNR
jgi:hypothetical protein